MACNLQITYLDHSAFAVRTPDTILIFDDAAGTPDDEEPLSKGRVSRALLQSHQHIFIFASHAHADHFNPDIYRRAQGLDAHFILGDDIPRPHPGHRLSPGDSLSLDGVAITAHASTDEGVSFLVRVGGWTLFHAGDLNLWHWRQESTPKEIKDAETEFEAAVEPLRGEPIDFAFFPVDPRMGEMHDAGALYFLMNARPRVMIPMHWWGRADVAHEFARRNRTRHVEVVALTAPGDSIRAAKEADGHIVLDL